jgi:hypothetical protein
MLWEKIVVRYLVCLAIVKKVTERILFFFLNLNQTTPKATRPFLHTEYLAY